MRFVFSAAYGKGRDEVSSSADLEGAEHAEVGLTNDEAEQQVDQGSNALSSRPGLQRLDF